MKKKALFLIFTAVMILPIAFASCTAPNVDPAVTEPSEYRPEEATPAATDVSQTDKEPTDSIESTTESATESTAESVTESATESETQSSTETSTVTNPPAHVHTEVAEGAIDPTCTEEGKTARIYCSECGETLVASSVAPALGHDIINHSAKAPTCTENGCEAYETCSRCDHSTYTEISAKGHTQIDVPAVAPTYTSDGKTEGKSCSSCGEILTPQMYVTKIDPAVADGNTGKLYIVMSSSRSMNTVYAKDKLTNFVKNGSGAALGFGSGSGTHELLLGDTGRAESVALKSSLFGDRYAIKIGGGKIVITATNDAFLYDAVEYFIAHYLTVSGTSIALNTVSAEYVGNGDTSSLRYLFTQSKNLVANNYRSDGWPDEIIKQPSGTTHVQGGCSDGTYIYQIFIKKDTSSNEVNNTCKIVKINPDFDPYTTAALMTTESLDLNHANDITYNPKTHELIVCHNNPNRTKLSIIDPDTLTVKRTVTIGQKIYSITYDADRDLYMVGCSGGQNMRTLSSDFSKLSATMYSSAPTQSMTTQGICSDDTFVYHTLWNSPGSAPNYNKNVVTVYDWYGNYVGMIGTKITIESENIFIQNGALYVAAYSSGGKGAYIYRIEPEIK